MSIESPSVKYRLLPPYKYQTLEKLVFLTDICPEAEIKHPYFTLSTDGILTVNRGYAWDGSSGGLDTKNMMRASLAHDVFFQANQLRLLLPPDWRVKANKLLIRLAKEDGMSSVRAWWVYKAVDMFGRGRPRDLNKYEEVKVAP